MKKSLKRIVLVVVILLGVFVLAGCNQKKTSEVVGQWASEKYDGVFIYTFNEDGTGTYELGETKKSFTWETEDSKITILYDGDMKAFEAEYRVEDNKLILKDSMGNDTVYTKK